MKTSFLATDAGLSVPVIIFPIGHVGGKSVDLLNGLYGLSFNCSLNSEKNTDLKHICQSKNVPLPNEIRSTIFILNDESDFAKIRMRFLLEPSISYLKWLVVVVFIDCVLNNDIEHLKEYAKTLSISLENDHINFFIFAYNSTVKNINNSRFDNFKTDEHLFFFFLDNNVEKNETSSISSIVSSYIDFLCPLIIQSIQNQISAIVTPDGTSSRKKTRSNKTVSAIPRITLTFLSTNLIDKIKIFTETIKIFEDEKSIDNQKYGEALELLGILESEHPGTSKKYQLIDKINIISHWDLEEKNDSLLLFSLAASYFLKNLPSRTLDCCFRILSFFTNGQAISVTAAVTSSTNSSNSFLTSSSNNINSNISCSTNTVNNSGSNLSLINSKTTNYINNKTIIFLIKECISIIERLNDEDMMQNRGIELITIVARLGQIRKIPMVCYQISKILRLRAKADFLLMGIKFLYEQNSGKNNELVIQKLAEPMAETLLKSVVFPLEKCSIIFKILSTIGGFLPKEKQDFLFMKMIDLSIGDVRIPCDIGLKVSYAQIITPVIEIVKVNKADKMKSNSIFLYNCLQGQSNYSRSEGNIASSSFAGSDITVGVGFQFRIEFDLFNPFSLDLPIFISCSKINHCSSEDYPLPLKAKTNNKLVCCLTPIDESEFTIDSVDCVIYSGVQRIVFPYPLRVKSINGVASFSVRTVLPIKQTLELFDGEIYHVRLWVTNTGSYDIENLSLRFEPTYLRLRNSKNPIYNEDEIPKLIQPCENVLINLNFNIISNMQSLSFDVVARTALNRNYEAVCHIEQPVNVKVGLNIASIYLLRDLPEPKFELSKFVFVGVSIQNNTEETFNYTASFNPPQINKSIKETTEKVEDDHNLKTPEKVESDKIFDGVGDVGNNTSLDNVIQADSHKSDESEFLSILSSTKKRGLLIGHETTTLIISIPKSSIENPPIQADRALKIAAARDEEAKLCKRLTNKQRTMLDLRVDMAEFIKTSLNFRWQRGSVRRGNLAMNTALPSQDLLEEAQTKRPQTFYRFNYTDQIQTQNNQVKNEEEEKDRNSVGDDDNENDVSNENNKIQDEHDDNMKTVLVKKRVILNVEFKLARVKKCKIDLGAFSDSDYGIMWNGSLEMEKNEEDTSNNFCFTFYFSQPGNFTFKAKYETFDSIKGFYPLNVRVIEQ